LCINLYDISKGTPPNMPAISGFDAALEPFHQELLDNYYVNKETWQKVTINKSRFLTSFTELDQIKRDIFMATWMTNTP
jgi:hypothetical protein